MGAKTASNFKVLLDPKCCQNYFDVNLGDVLLKGMDL